MEMRFCGQLMRFSRTAERLHWAWFVNRLHRSK